MPKQIEPTSQKPNSRVPTQAASHANSTQVPITEVQQGASQRTLANPSTLSPATVIQLQRSAGNRAVVQLLSGTATTRGSSVQRSRAAGSEGGALEDKMAHTIRRSQSGGKAMPTGVRAALEPRLGVDLSTVKVHTDHQAVQLNRDLGAKAFTHKNHIYYGAGQRPADLQLTAHETVHTIQQGAVSQPLDSQMNASSLQTKRDVQTKRIPQGQKRIQRLSVDDKPIRFDRSTAVTLSVSGADGVYFFHEGPLYQPGSTVAVKPTNDSVGDTVATTAMLNKLSGGKVPKTIDGNQYKGQVRNILDAPNMSADWARAWKKKIDAEENPVAKDDPYLGTAERFKTAKLEHFDNAQNLYVMGLAGGQSFREKVAQGQNATAAVLEPSDLIKLGRATAVDIFMGNADRLVSGNLGNWMVDVDKTLYLIDNVQAADLNRLRTGSDFSKTWDIYLSKLKTSNLENTASALARKLLVSAHIANHEDIKIQGRSGQVVKDVNWKGMIGQTTRPGKKDPSKSVSIQESDLKPEYLSTKEKYLMQWLLKGLTKGRRDIIHKLAPKRGQRSRSLKSKIVKGGGQQQWDEIKERAQKLKDLG